MFCEECGTKNGKGTKFCTNCGHKVGDAPKNEERKVDLNAAVDNVTDKGKELLEKGKDFYAKKPKVVYGIIGAIVLIIILLVITGGKTMKCEAEDDYTTYNATVKYDSDDEVTKIHREMVIDLKSDDFEELLDMLDTDIDEYVEEMQDELEDGLDEAEDGYDASIKKSGNKIISTETYEGEALEEFLEYLEVKDIDDLEDYLEDGYTEYKCEK